MASYCDRFIPPAMTYGVGCAICGYPEKTHVKTKKTDDNTSRKHERQPARPQEKRKNPTIKSHHTKHTATEKVQSRSIKRDDDSAPTDRSIASNMSADGGMAESLPSAQQTRRNAGHTSASRTRADRHKKIQAQPAATGRTIERRGMMESVGITGRGHRAPRPSQSEAIKETLDKQANLLALAGDAARHNGDTASAQTFYEESADAVMDRLRLDLSKIKTKAKPRHDGRTNERTTRSDHDSEPNTARSEISTNRTDRTDRSDRSDMHQTAWAGAVSADRSHAASYKVTGKRGYLDVSDSKKKSSQSASQAAQSQTENLLQQANYGPEKRQKLTQLFYSFSNGAPALTADSFAELIGYTRCPGDLDSYFCAFDRSKKRSWIDITDFLLGCAAMDPATSHSGVWRTERAKYIFRYYADNGVELSRDRFNDLIDHIVAITQDTPWKLIEGAEKVFAGHSTMTFRNFNNACSNLPCLSQLFRYRISRGLKIDR